MKTKKKRWPILAAAGAVLIAAIIIILVLVSHRWRPLKDVPQWSWVREASVQKIRLRESVTSPDWAVSEDDDLIRSWTDFLSLAEVKRNGLSVHLLPVQGGGAAVIDLFTDKAQYSIQVYRQDGEDYLVTNGVVYTVKGDAFGLFEQTFKEILNRGGAATPWD